MSFVNLHSHSEYSLLDGVGTIKEIVAKAKEQESPAIAITDHGNCNAWVQLYTECKEKGIKPIYGSEMYYALDAKEKKGGNMHLIVLAKNKVGFKNLLKLNGWAHKHGFYRKPRIDFDVLKEYKEGLIILSGCTSGIVSKRLIEDDYWAAFKWAEKFKYEFGDDYYLEMQVHDFADQVVVNKGIMKISEKLGIKTVITNDFHYVNEADGLLQDVMALIKQKKTWKDRQDALDRIARGEKANMPWELGCKQLWMKSEEEMLAAWKKWHKEYMPLEVFKASIKQSVKISETIDNIEMDSSYKFPNVDTKGKTLTEAFEKVMFDGFINRGFKKDKNSEPYKRLMYEYKIMNDLGLLPYFMILADAIMWAKENDIMVGCGRGSAAGSLVCYSLGITGINPLEHGLMFERFINPARKDMPDIDVDFESLKGEKIEEYLIDKYGEDKVGHICTFGMMQLRSAIKDVSRVMGGDPKATNTFTSILPNDIDKEIKKSYPKLKDFMEAFREPMSKFLAASEKHERILKTAWKLKGRIRHISKHPAGTVITPKPLDHLLALQRHGGQLLIGWTEGQKKELTPFGFVKYDILKIKTLDIIKRALQLIKKNHGKSIDIEKIPLTEKKVFKKMSKGESLGSFQFETDIMAHMLKDLKPDKFSDLSALNALDRPGPLRMKMDKAFYSLKHGVEDKLTRKMVKKVMRDMFPETYGVVLYQEQVMVAAMQLADFSVLEADDMRRTITKNVGKFDKPEIKKLLDEVKHKFISRATKKIGADDAKFVWEIIFKFTEYGFNKAHSVSYAMIGYQCMYLKVEYPREFFCGMLQWSKGKDTKDYIEDAKDFGIKVRRVDINKSGMRFKPEGESSIRYPLGHIRDVKKAAARIVEEQPGYKSFDDFLSKIHGKRVNKNAILSLIKAGAFDSFKEESRSQLYYRYLKLKAKPKERDKIEVKEWSIEDKLRFEKEAYDFEFSEQLLDEVFDKLKDRFGIKTPMECLTEEPGYQARTGGIIRGVREYRAKNGVMGFIDLQFKGEKSTSLTIFGDRWKSLKKDIKPGRFVECLLTVSEYRDKKNFVLSSRGGAENYIHVFNN